MGRREPSAARYVEPFSLLLAEIAYNRSLCGLLVRAVKRRLKIVYDRPVHMRHIILFDHVSADGYFATEDGKLDWVVSDEELAQFNLRTMADADTILFGRRTYEMFESFWPNAMKDPRGPEDPHQKGHHSESLRQIGQWIDDAAKIVFSRTRKTVTWRGSQVIDEFNRAQVDDFKRAAGKNMILLGSGELTRLMARHRLIDEYQFGVVPVILGKGQKLLDDLDGAQKVSLAESHPLPTGTLLLRYTVA